MDFPQSFEAHLKQLRQISSGDKVLIACSGGPDSVCLFHLLLSLKKKWKLRLTLLHLNHGLRGRDAWLDAQFVVKLGKKHRIPVISEKSDIKIRAEQKRESIEEAARHARYAFFLKAARRKKVSKVVLAHTQEDQAETILMRMLQGTGMRGLAGIRPVWKREGVTFVRPLLDFSKKQILEYLNEEKIKFRKDKSNESEQFLRNRIRRRVLPFLSAEINPKAIEALARIPAILKDENDFLQELEDEAFKKTFIRKQAEKVLIRRKPFLTLASPLQFRILNRMLKEIDTKSGLDFSAWQRLRVNLNRKAYRHSLPRDIDFLLSPSKLMLYRK